MLNKPNFEMSKYVISQGWLSGSLKPKVVILSKEEKRLKKVGKLPEPY